MLGSFVTTDNEVSEIMSSADHEQPFKEVYPENTPPRAVSQQMDYSTGASRVSTISTPRGEEENFIDARVTELENKLWDEVIARESLDDQLQEVTMERDALADKVSELENLNSEISVKLTAQDE